MKIERPPHSPTTVRRSVGLRPNATSDTTTKLQTVDGHTDGHWTQPVTVCLQLLQQMTFQTAKITYPNLLAHFITNDDVLPLTLNMNIG